MKLGFNGLLSCLLPMLLSASALAHHSAPAFFDMRGFVSVEGSISGSRLENPHSYYRVTTADGTNWAWESGPSWTALAKDGWSTSTLPEGTRVRMSGMPSLVDKPIARFDHIVVFGTGDGTRTEIYGLTGNSDWARRVSGMGEACSTGIADCRSLDSLEMQSLAGEFGDIGVWSELVE